MKLNMGAIELDASIQCRAAIDTAVVNDYAERMAAGDNFPPIVVFGSKTKCWIGDGWHRVFAVKELGIATIEGILRNGGRPDALRHALGANIVHGHRRSNADKRRCVEIALREFPKLSGRAIAKMCGVSAQFANAMQPEVSSVDTSTRIGLDGKQRPAHPTRLILPLSGNETARAKEDTPDRPSGYAGPLGPPRNGLQFARMAIFDLEQITDDDEERDAAFALIEEWINARKA